MRRFLTVLSLLLAITLPAAADKAKSIYKKGVDAEARQNWEQAYEFYKQAYDLKPKELRYRTAYLRSRTQAATSMVHRGILLRDNGNLQEAVAAFQRAAEIDPALDIAQTELRRTRLMIEKSQPPPPSSVPQPTELGEQALHALGPAELKPIENTPITLRMTEDTKQIYTAIGGLAGINVLFDPDYVSRRISIDLKNVSLYQALEIVALESKTFWRPVTSNTIFVAADTKTKRQELESQVVKTFYLANAYSTTDVQDALNTIRTVTDITRLVNLTAQNAIVVRGTPDQVALAEKLIGDIDKARPEVVVDVAVMQVSKDKLRQMGINPPGQASVSLQNNVTTTNNNNNNTSGNGTTGTGTSTTSSTQALTLNKLANLTSNDFFVNIPSASVQFMLSDSDTKIIQNPEVRALNGTKATLKIGDRVPVATGSFSGAGGVAGLGVSPLVNTQFQYIDVGVNIDITPVVHLDNEVSLKIVMEVSSVTSHVSIGGIDQPVIGQRRIEHEIRLKDGEVSLMGGMLEDTNLKSLAGWPFLSQIPIIKYLFSQENTEHRTNEIVFALTPHVVRAHDITEQNLRPIDVGTQNAIELRRGGAPAVTQPAAPPAVTPQAAPPMAPGRAPVAPAQSGVPQQPPAPAVPGQSQMPAQSSQPITPGAAPPGSPPVQPGTAQTQPAAPAQTQAATTPAILSFEPAQITQSVGSAFGVNVSIANATNVYAVPVEISYDPKQLQLLNVSPGQFLQKDGQPVALVHRGDESKGTLIVNATRPPGAPGLSGQGTVFTLTFMAKAPGQSMLNITRAGARDPGQNALPVNAGQAMVTVK
jgi:general secretion pathway protein D